MDLIKKGKNVKNQNDFALIPTISITVIDGENEERVLMQRFDSRTGERVLWIIYGSCLDNPVFNDYKKSLVKFGPIPKIPYFRN